MPSGSNAQMFFESINVGFLVCITGMCIKKGAESYSVGCSLFLYTGLAIGSSVSFGCEFISWLWRSSLSFLLAKYLINLLCPQ